MESLLASAAEAGSAQNQFGFRSHVRWVSSSKKHVRVGWTVIRWALVIRVNREPSPSMIHVHKIFTYQTCGGNKGMQ